MKARKPQRNGFTLIEMLVYIGLLSIVGTVLILFGAFIIRQSGHTQLTAVVVGNARGAMDDMTREIRRASGVYSPTSVFDTYPGQLSLATTELLPDDENETYVDFYIDDERLYRKREGGNAQLLTSEQVKVTNLVFTHLNESNNGSAVRVELTVEPAQAAPQTQDQTTVTLVATATLRAL